jgi:hypothetical protein
MMLGLTIYRVELVGGGVVFAENEPKPSRTTLVFRSSPQGNLVALRRSEVARVERIEADNKPPLDLGRGALKQGATPAALPAQTRSSWKPADDGRRYPQRGDEIPGNRVAFPVSRDDLLYGNYRAFPGANAELHHLGDAPGGGQSGPPPLIVEGRGIPIAGSLGEPPKAIQLPGPPTGPNVQAPVAPLVFSEKPHIDEIQTPNPAPPPRRPDSSG